MPSGTISSSGTSVTGTGTFFTTEVPVNQVVIANGEAKAVVSVTDDTHLTVNTAWQDSTPSGSSFTVAGRGIARNGDPCGGVIEATALTTFVNFLPVARLTDPISAHGTGPHAAATLVESSLTVVAEGKFICRLGDAASCGHTISSASLNSFNSL